jgi:hypothetical protein
MSAPVAQPTVDVPEVAPSSKLFPNIKNDKTCQISTKRCKQGMRLSYDNCPDHFITAMKFYNSKYGFTDYRIGFSDDDDYNLYPISDDDNDDNRTPTKPHFKVLQCYDPTYKYVGPLAANSKRTGNTKYADECASFSVQVTGIPRSQPWTAGLLPSSIPDGCKVQFDAGDCVRKSMCRSYCTSMLYLFAGKRPPGRDDDFGLDDDYGDDDSQGFTLGVPTITGCDGCSMVPKPKPTPAPPKPTPAPHVPAKNHKKAKSAGAAAGVTIAVLTVVG